MKIGGYQKSSLTDFPGHIAAVVFTQGCTWRCPFCHNRSLVHPARFQPSIPEEEVFDHLELHRGRLDGVVVTGGEPTLQHGIINFFRHVRRMGFATKLDTNGSQPTVISALLQEELLDCVAMDIKGPLGEYARFTGCEVDTGPLELSIELIKRSGITHEFRTTLVGGLHTKEHIDEMAPLMYGVSRYAVQSYRPLPGESKPHDPFSPPSDELLHTAGEALRERVTEFVMR